MGGGGALTAVDAAPLGASASIRMAKTAAAATTPKSSTTATIIRELERNCGVALGAVMARATESVSSDATGLRFVVLV